MKVYNADGSEWRAPKEEDINTILGRKKKERVHKSMARFHLKKLSPRERRELWAEFAKLDGRDSA